MGIDKYLHAPWHDSKKELPEHSGLRCICYNTFHHCEMEMIFYKGHDGYKDFFKEVAKGNRAYDYSWIKYWKYYTDKEYYGN